MKRFVQVALVLLAFVPASVGHVQAQSDQAVARACAGLESRVRRQSAINEGHKCQMRSRQGRPIADAAERCNRADRAYLKALTEERGAALERCVARRLEQADKARIAVTPSGQNTTPSPRGTLRQASGLAAAGTQSGSNRGGRPGSPSDRQAAGQRIKDLLAAGPKPKQGPSADSEGAGGRDLTFRTGLMWSYAGALTGMSCVQWREPSDPHNWDDNFLCSDRDVGFQWSFRGPILGRGLKCIQVREKSDPHDWHDNYFCWPRDLKVTFRFSATGRISGFRCIAIVEPSDPHTWRDNYLCHRAKDK